MCEFSDGMGVKKERGGHLNGEGYGVPRAAGTDPQVPVSQRVEVRLGQESALKVNNPA